MGVETATYISQLSATNPLGTDPISEGDDQIRLVKEVLQAQFTSLGAAAVTATATELNLIDGYTGTTAELNTLDVTTQGTSEASKVLTADSNGDVTIADGAYDFDVASHDGTNGLKLAGTLVTATAAEMNYLDITTLGTSANSKALTQNASGEITIGTGSASTGVTRGVPITITQGTLIDLDTGNNFLYTPAAADELSFANETTGQSGFIKLINPSGYAISLGSEVKAVSTFATDVSTAGTYLVTYFCDGTNVYVSASAALV
ncbi:MAG: hypothetical protein QF535_20700 [Anaerolineales bacterium]|nr:hypothetical protein [Anaerolineales bacterium]